MNLKNFKDKVFKIARKKGFEAQIEFHEIKEFSVRFSNGELDQYTDAGKFYLSIKVLKEGKIGSSYTETIETPEKYVEEAISNWEIIDSKDENFFHDGTGKYIKMETYNGEFEKLPVKEKLGFVKTIYESAKSDPKIVMVPLALYEDFVQSVQISNTLGLEVEMKSDGARVFSMAITADKSKHSGIWGTVAKKVSELNPEKIGKKARDEALAMLGAKSVKSGKYRAIIRHTALQDILSLLNSMVSAENIQKNMSPLKEKIGKQIASTCVNILDMPFHPLSIQNKPFDSEGVPTIEKAVIEQGILKTYLYNLKTAKKDNTKSTGNAHNGAISFINMTLVPGNKSFEELIDELDNGLIIIGVDGIHSGANPISGNFSLGARGYEVKNGKLSGAVEQITISANFLTLLNNIETVGNDVHAAPFRAVICPSVLVNEIDVAGE
ncbi:TldD/PmbA family protein [Thermosipho ferrireducens]|uniref:TldD/PmbA family protein n=1 Tax=Thermosipho ferrireducens TaxID=2571116 RepID=A0ABX7S7G2_9BACT|nr:TldD/PmbA family protein [Thermosipho ferrireducens]QTA37735.1 TldD/PmbA family protein [Thermosipho ferrireducens]